MNLRLDGHRNGSRLSRSDQLFGRGTRSIVDAISPGAIEASRSHLMVDGQYLQIGNMYAVAPFYVLIIILMIRPYGLFGTEAIERL